MTSNPSRPAAATATTAALTGNHIIGGVVFLVVFFFIFRRHSASACVQGQGGLSLESILRSRVVGRGGVKKAFKPNRTQPRRDRTEVVFARLLGTIPNDGIVCRIARRQKVRADRLSGPTLRCGCGLSPRFLSSPTFALGVAKSCEAASFRPHHSSLLVHCPVGKYAGPSAGAGGRRAAVAAALEVGEAW